MGNKSTSINCKIDANIIFHLDNNKKIFEKLKIKSVNIFYNNRVIKYEISKRLSNLINDNVPFEIEFVNKDSNKKEHYIFSQNFKHDKTYSIKINKDCDYTYHDYFNVNNPNCKIRLNNNIPKFIILHSI